VLGMAGGAEGAAESGATPRYQTEMLEQERSVKQAKQVQAVQSISRDVSFSSLFMLML